ncbi:MAG: phosphotransferase [Alphaproteobacteria bacterium]|nr:phosphotransferase [Alphaproteobacteria bacterium]
MTMKHDVARAFDLGGEFDLRLVNVSENETYRIDTAAGPSFALRITRPGYHTAEEIASEMAWLESLHEERVIDAAKPLRGRNGAYLQQIGARQGVLFSWEAGVEPQIGDDLAIFAETLGGIAARLHDHVERWQRPAFFTRPHWDFDAAFGAEKRWGDWRQGLGVTPEMLPLYGRAVDVIEQRLKAYGQAPSRFNLIHGDLRLANLLVDGAAIKVIDFDDSGFSWFMYDAANMISFHEHEAQSLALIAHWIEGYRKLRVLTKADEAEIRTFIMFRRILLTAWLGSHAEIDLAREVKPAFARQTADLCEAFLSGKAY